MFRVNTLKESDAEVMDVLRGDAWKFERILGVPYAFQLKEKNEHELLAHPLAREGKIYIQGISSMLPPFVLDPKPGEIVLDLCAAPGSKTSQITAMTGNTGTLVACENDEIRFERLAHTVKLQGAKVELMHADAALACRAWPERFDAVLADVPCSAEGRILLSEPRSFRFWSQKNIHEHARLQRRLLTYAVPTLKPGGRLVYSTCTLAPEENEEMMAWLLATFPELKPVPFTLPIAAVARKPAGKVILPSKLAEGMFVAKFRKA